MSSHGFPKGARAHTHSLSTAEYNGLKGSETGPAVESSGVTRVPVSLQLPNGIWKVMSLQPKSLNKIGNVANVDPSSDIQCRFCNAIVQGNVKNMINCVQLRADVNSGYHNTTPVYMATQRGYAGMIIAFSALGSDINLSFAEDGSTPIIVAVALGHVDAIKALVELGESPNAIIGSGGTVMHVCAQFGHLDVIKTLADLGADVNTRDTDGVTSIFILPNTGTLTLPNISPRRALISTLNVPTVQLL
jgi:hypothetical protein